MRKVVIADDEVRMRKQLEAMVPWERFSLELCGMAGSGDELERLIREYTPEIVLTDIVMPGKKVLEVAQKMKQEIPSLHIILVSAYADFEYARSALHLGLDDILPKPVVQEELNEILESICESEAQKEEEGILKTTEIASENPTVRKIVKYVNEHYKEKISLDTAARVVYMNPVYLSRLFKQETGINFVNYLTEVRLREAQRLLKVSRYNINEVSMAVGLENISYFSRLFREKTGMRPVEYRKKYLND